MKSSVYCLLFLVVAQVCFCKAAIPLTAENVIKSIEADNDLEIIDFLKMGLNPNAMVLYEKLSHTLLTLCARIGASKSAYALIKAGANVELENAKLWRPLQVSAEFKHPEVTRVLLDGGAYVDSIEHVGNNTALHVASFFVSPEIQKMLIAAGANIEARDVRKETPLHKAAYVGNAECVDVLLAAGADPNAVKEDLKTPLHYAAMEGHPGPVMSLLKAGSNPTARDVDGMTALDLAIKRGKQATIQILEKIH